MPLEPLGAAMAVIPWDHCHEPMVVGRGTTSYFGITARQDAADLQVRAT